MDQHTELLDLVRAPSEYEFLSPLLLHLIQRSVNTAGLCPPLWRRFLGDLARRSPVPNGLVRNTATMAGILDTLIASDRDLSSVDVMVIRSSFPVLHDLLQKLNLHKAPCTSEEIELMAVLRPILNRLRTFCDYLSVLPDERILEEAIGMSSSSAADAAEDLEAGEWWPNAPVLRSLRRYNQRLASTERVCTKNAPAFRLRLRPGIFLFVCPHGTVFVWGFP